MQRLINSSSENHVIVRAGSVGLSDRPSSASGRLKKRARPVQPIQTDVSMQKIRWPEFNTAGAHCRSQEMSLPKLGQKKMKIIEDRLVSLKLGKHFYLIL